MWFNQTLIEANLSKNFVLTLKRISTSTISDILLFWTSINHTVIRVWHFNPQIYTLFILPKQSTERLHVGRIYSVPGIFKWLFGC